MTGGFVFGAILLVACAYFGEKNALYIPAIVLAVAGAANAIAGPLL